MKKKYEKAGLVANIILAFFLLISLIGDYFIEERLSNLQYEESKDRELFISNYTGVILDYLVYDAGQARLSMQNVLGEADVLVSSTFPMDIKVVNKKNPNQTVEFNKIALLDKAQKLQGHDFIENSDEIYKLRLLDTILFILQIVLVLCVIIVNSISFTFFKSN